MWKLRPPVPAIVLGFNRTPPNGDATPGRWKIHHPAHCFASVTARTENKNVTIMPDRFICFVLTVKQSAALAACVLRATKKGRQLFEEKSVPA